jgi:sulfate/thiosulfate-binding protein
MTVTSRPSAMTRLRIARDLVFLAGALGLILFVTVAAHAQTTLLNVSYDPTRELYKDINKAFAASWKKQTGQDVEIKMSHGGSGKQARSVIDGLDASVVTLALAADIDEIAKQTGKIPADWQKRLPNNASPYTSTIVFLVRKGNPKGIKDWDDLAKPGLQVITPNPKTSGGARWNYLAAWGYQLGKTKGDEKAAKDFLAAIFKNVPVLDTGARGSTITFAQRGLGDVLVAWENEAYLSLAEFGADKFDIVVPSVSILAEPPVSLVDGNLTDANKAAAKAYLDFLYTDEAQAIIAKNFYRPSKPEAAAKEDVARLPAIKLFTIDEVFGGWGKAQKTHFADGGVFDEIQKAAK